MGHGEQNYNKPTSGQQVFTAPPTYKYKSFWIKRISAVERANRQKRAQVHTVSWRFTCSTNFPGDPMAGELVRLWRKATPTQQFLMFVSHVSRPLLLAFSNLILAVTKVTSIYFNLYAHSCSFLAGTFLRDALLSSIYKHQFFPYILNWA